MIQWRHFFAVADRPVKHCDALKTGIDRDHSPGQNPGPGAGEKSTGTGTT